MLFIGNGFVGAQDVERSSTSAAVATADTVTVAIPAASKPGVYSAKEPTESISKAPKENWITGTVSRSGAKSNKAA